MGPDKSTGLEAGDRTWAGSQQTWHAWVLRSAAGSGAEAGQVVPSAPTAVCPPQGAKRILKVPP